MVSLLCSFLPLPIVFFSFPLPASIPALSLPVSNNWLIFTMYLQGVTPAADPIESKQTADAKYDPEDPELLKPVQPINNQYVDPFAHEESSEVKYKTLQWWYVKASPRVDIYAPS